MALVKLTQKKFNDKQMESIIAHTKSQTTSMVSPKSEDPENFPVWEVKPGERVLVYVPNYVTINDETGEEEFRMDKSMRYMVTQGNRFTQIRSVEGLPGYARDPMRDVVSICWDLANMQIEERCRREGLDPDDRDMKEVKNIRSQFFREKMVDGPRVYYTFPIVVFETEGNGAKLTLQEDEEGHPKCKVYWLDISESQYDKTWRSVLDVAEDEPSHPGGQLAILNYGYTKGGKNTISKRDAGRDMTVTLRSNKQGILDHIEWLDGLAKDWTPAKSIETVIANHLYEEEGLEALAADLESQVREKIMILEAGGMSSSDDVSLDALSSGKGGDENVGLIPAGEVDEDEDE